MFPTRRGTLWTKDDWDNWRNRVFKPTAVAVGASTRPYDLRHTFASLLIASGVTAVEAAAQLGHDPVLTLRTYAHLFDEFDLGSRPDPVSEIDAARAQSDVRAQYAAGDEGSAPEADSGGVFEASTTRSRLLSASSPGMGVKPTSGFEPLTPSLRVKCSTS